MALKHNIEEWVNKFIGDWKVLGYSHSDKEQYWTVQCSCGKVEARRASQLRLGRTHSCRTCASKKRESEKSPFWKGLRGVSAQYLNKLSFRNKEVSVSLEDLVSQWELQKGCCVYTGVKLTLVSKDTLWKQSTASLDRIDSSKGYISGNIQWVHKRINTMKNDMSENEFISWCINVCRVANGG